jgi:hypothetical protein
MTFRSLKPNEEAQFRDWARNNYEPGAEISGIWHPVVQDECVKINREKALFVPEGELARARKAKPSKFRVGETVSAVRSLGYKGIPLGQGESMEVARIEGRRLLVEWSEISDGSAHRGWIDEEDVS